MKIWDIVLVVEENLSTNKWPLGRIIEVIHGKNKKLIVVTKRTQKEIFKKKSFPKSVYYQCQTSN